MQTLGMLPLRRNALLMADTRRGACGIDIGGNLAAHVPARIAIRRGRGKMTDGIVPPTGLSGAPGPARRAPRGARVAAAIVTVSVAAIVGLSLWFLVQPQTVDRPGRGGCDAHRCRGARRRAHRHAPGRARRHRRGRPGAGDHRQSRTRRQARRGRGGESRGGGRLRPHRGRHAAGGGGGAQGGDRGRRRQCRPGAADLRPDKDLAQRDFASAQKLDEATASLDVANRSLEQAKLSYEEAVAGYTVEERGVAKANVDKAVSAIETLGRRSPS